MQTRRIADRTVSAIGLGAMPMSVSPAPDEQQAIATIHAALDAGVTLLDTADAYAPDGAEMGHSERLLAKALVSWGGDRSSITVATKGGHIRTEDGGWELDGSPAYLRKACEASLQALGTDVIDLYQFHRPDPRIPFVESVGALADLRHEGKIRHIGVSNVDVGQIDAARTITTIAAVQNQFSPAFRSSSDELERCAELGIAFLPWSPLGGMGDATTLGERFPTIAAVAADRGVSAQQVCLAWMLGLADVVIPIPGASRPQSITDSAAAADLQLSGQEIARLSRF
ncbi:MAG TPA: aldo/keto reductase [Mycobacteriales bacterium]|jgi:aryl-alcohol dehydrogenase-like predicted oxidoreductase|nr:aldo/keto reductase [Mycobacteriales bacterium]